MDILENQAYHRRLLMYKGVEKPEALLDTAKADDTTIATQGYGVGNYYFVTGDRAKARRSSRRVLAAAAGMRSGSSPRKPTCRDGIRSEKRRPARGQG